MVLGWCIPSSMLRSLGNRPRTTEKECVKQIGRQRKATRNSALMSAGRPVMALVLINRRWVSSVDSSMFTSWGHLLSCIIDNWKASVWRYYIFLLLVFFYPYIFLWVPLGWRSILSKISSLDDFTFRRKSTSILYEYPSYDLSTLTINYLPLPSLTILSSI